MIIGKKGENTMGFTIRFGPSNDCQEEYYYTLKETADRCRELLEKNVIEITIEHRGRTFTAQAILPLSP